ncbi:Interferon alpha-inducible protein 27, mitochondrial [Manis javanica]|nr:Interferon alpha-inducible protein 27, mitochondrial [Manis javanica]
MRRPAKSKLLFVHFGGKLHPGARPPWDGLRVLSCCFSGRAEPSGRRPPRELPCSLPSPGVRSFPGLRSDRKGLAAMQRAAVAAVGGVIAVVSVPVVLGTMGFTSAGIAASSVAAKMMSAAAISNGGGVAAGSLVATLQSVGAAGLSTSSNILLACVGSTFGALLGGSKKKPPSPPPAGSEDAGDQPEKKDS